MARGVPGGVNGTEGELHPGPASARFRLGMGLVLVGGLLSVASTAVAWGNVALGASGNVGSWTGLIDPDQPLGPWRMFQAGAGLLLWAAALFLGYRRRSKWTFVVAIVAAGAYPLQPVVATGVYLLVISPEVMEIWRHGDRPVPRGGEGPSRPGPHAEVPAEPGELVTDDRA